VWVTCYTDASWYDEKFAGGWAYHLKCDQGSFHKAGECPSWVNCSATAEMSAIIAGVYRAVRLFDNVEGVGVFTDCHTAIHYLEWQPDTIYRRKDWLVIQNKFRRMLYKYKCRAYFTHVKGHRSSKQGVSAFLNNKVDRLSREMAQKV